MAIENATTKIRRDAGFDGRDARSTHGIGRSMSDVEC